MRAKNFVFNRGVSCFIRGVSCFIRGVSCFIRGVSCFIRCILSCFIRYNPVFQSWSSRRERVKSRLFSESSQKTGKISHGFLVDRLLFLINLILCSENWASTLFTV